MSNDPTRQGQYPPPPWSSGQPERSPSSQHSSGQSSPAPYHYTSQPPPPPSTMAAIQPHIQHPQQDQYHLPPPHGAYQRPPEMYHHQPPPPPSSTVVYPAAAPRQRTAIACRYCRRRKIRCSGFETSQDGRCSNCARFNQECMFTPVSSQAQAFVPAHAIYHIRGGLQARGRGGYPEPITLYGAHGQPLPPPQQPMQHPEGALPPPHGMYGPPPPLPHPPTLQDHRPSQPTTLPPVSAAVSGPPYQSHQAPAPAGYYPPPGQDRRASTHSQYAYEPRHSSPLGAASSAPNLPYPPMQQQPVPPRAGVTPPPGPPAGPSGRSGLSVREMLGPESQGTRSSTDSDMLNALNRTV
ncbi:hypothetical protein FQN51_006100 [Onygenales sp. PD_10]|nr:hypothetical protein FQN51_006100 [Onygenales sp. PD_10]